MRSVLRPSDIVPEDLLDRLFKARLANKIDQLSEQDKNVLIRMEYADDLIRDGGPFMVYKNVVAEMLAKFEESHGVGKRTIESDIARAKKFFLSNYKREDKEYARGTRVQWLDSIAAKAENAGDYKSAIAALKEGDEILGLKTNDPDMIDHSKVQPAPVLVIADPTMIGLPAIDNLEEKIRLYSMPKDVYQRASTEQFDDAELDDDGEVE